MSKNKDLGFEANKMWDMTTEIIPVIVGALGLTKKRLDKVTSRIPGNVSTNEIQKITVPGTTHILITFPITPQVHCSDPATMDGKQENVTRTSSS